MEGELEHNGDSLFNNSVEGKTRIEEEEEEDDEGKESNGLDDPIEFRSGGES